MTVLLVHDNGRQHWVYVQHAQSETAAIREALRQYTLGWHPAWVLPGDVR